MRLLKTFSVFIWFSFLYWNGDCTSEKDSELNAAARGLSREQQRQLYDELTTLSPQRRQQLFQDLQRQGREFDLSQSKWARLRQTTDLNPISQSEIDSIRKTIRSGANPVIRNKRTLKFLVKSMAEILGLRWTLLKYSLLPGAVDALIGPTPAPPAPSQAPPGPAAPRAPAGKAAAPPPRRLPPPSKPAPPPPPPPPRKPPPSPPLPRRPPPPPPPLPPKPGAAAPPNPPPASAKPAAAPAAPPARPPPPTIPPNQIDANTIRYPFRPAPTIPFLTFAPLPPGVTVPYPPLFQWPTLAPAPAAGIPAPAAGIPAQPPCAAPPPAAPAPAPRVTPNTPSRLPLPKPRLPVPPPKPSRPVLPASPSRTPLKLEYDHPVRIEIFNNVKPYLPASSSVYSGEPTLSDLEEQDETERYLNPTQAIHAIDEQYNTEPAQEYNKDYDYDYYTRGPNHLVLEEEIHTTPQVISNYDDNRQNSYGNREKSNEDYYDDKNQNYEETTPSNRYNGFASNSAFNDYPEQVEENRAHVNIKVSNLGRARGSESRGNPKRIRKPKKQFKNLQGSESKSNWNSVVHQSKSTVPWSTSNPPSTTKSSQIDRTSGLRGRNRFVSESGTVPTTNFPDNHSRQWKRVAPRPIKYHNNSKLETNQFSEKTTLSPSSSPKYQSISRHGNSFSDSQNFTPGAFRIVVPHAPTRKRRDIFFDDAFKNFNSSAFESFFEQKSPESTQPQFLENDGKLIPATDYRKKLEKDVEKYVEKYVEQQITKGQIDVTKPKTTIIELKTKQGPPIKTITTTVSKIVDGDKPFLQSILEYSKDINPVSNIGELSGEPSQEETEQSEVSRAFQNNPGGSDDTFNWNFSK